MFKDKKDYNEYSQKWRNENSDKIKIIKHRFNINHRDEISDYNLRYHQEKPWKRLLLSAKNRSKKYNLEFTLTEEWIKSVWTGRCAITDIEFYIGPSADLGGNSLSPSLDRIDNSRGYTLDNCRIILWCINRFKGQMTDEAMMKMVKILHDKFY